MLRTEALQFIDWMAVLSLRLWVYTQYEKISFLYKNQWRGFLSEFYLFSYTSQAYQRSRVPTMMAGNSSLISHGFGAPYTPATPYHDGRQHQVNSLRIFIYFILHSLNIHVFSLLMRLKESVIGMWVYLLFINTAEISSSSPYTIISFLCHYKTMQSSKSHR